MAAQQSAKVIPVNVVKHFVTPADNCLPSHEQHVIYQCHGAFGDPDCICSYLKVLIRRATARLQLERPAAALEDAVAVLSVEPNHREALRLEVKHC